MKDIILSIKRDGFRGDQPDPTSGLAEFKLIRKDVLERDLHQCQFCDFHAPKYQEVHHVDDDHENNDPENLITSCVLCHMCFHIGFAGLKNRGVLIYLEEGKSIPNFQARLNNLVRVLWLCTYSENKKIAMQATDYLKRLESLRIPASDYLGTSDPVFLANYLRELGDSDYRKRNEKLDGIFLLPLREGYPSHIKYWKQKDNSKVIESISEISKMNSLEWIGVNGKSQDMSGLKEFLLENDAIF